MAQLVYVSKSQLKFTLKRLTTGTKEADLAKQFEVYLTDFQLDYVFKINGIKDHFEAHNGLNLREIERDDLSMIFPDKHSRYHLSQDCLASKSDYINGHIPEEFRNPVDAQLYRAWFKEIQQEIIRDGEILEERFHILHQSKWGFTYSSKLNSGTNTGTTEFKAITKRELIAEAYKIRTRIDQQIIDELERGENTTISYIMKYAKIKSKETNSQDFIKLVKENGDNYERVVNWLNDYRKKFQYPLSNTFTLLYIMKHFPNSSLDIDLAQALGFVPCKVCSKSI